jgi:hypothetical protein
VSSCGKLPEGFHVFGFFWTPSLSKYCLFPMLGVSTGYSHLEGQQIHVAGLAPGVEAVPSVADLAQHETSAMIGESASITVEAYEPNQSIGRVIGAKTAKFSNTLHSHTRIDLLTPIARQCGGDVLTDVAGHETLLRQLTYKKRAGLGT